MAPSHSNKPTVADVLLALQKTVSRVRDESRGFLEDEDAEKGAPDVALLLDRLDFSFGCKARLEDTDHLVLCDGTEEGHAIEFQLKGILSVPRVDEPVEEEGPDPSADRGTGASSTVTP